MPGKIFVNYRRDDSAAHALNIAQYLEREFGAANVFLDIDRMRAGQRFPKLLEERLAVSKVMLVVIGPAWLTLKNDAGERRLDDPEGWVRLEIARGLARGIPVIPVLVGGAPLPRKADLPDDLKALVEHHVATVTTNGFRNEMAGLARDLRDLLGPRRRWPYAAALAGIAVAAALALPLVGVPVPWQSNFAGQDAVSEAPPSQFAAPKRKDDEGQKAASEAKRQVEAEAKAKAAEDKKAKEQRVAALAAEEERMRQQAEAKGSRCEAQGGGRGGPEAS